MRKLNREEATEVRGGATVGEYISVPEWAIAYASYGLAVAISMLPDDGGPTTP